MELEVAVLERVRAYESLSRWEKSGLGRELRRLGLSYGDDRGEVHAGDVVPGVIAER